MLRTRKRHPEGPLHAARIPRAFPLRLVTLAVLTAALIALSVMIAAPFLHAVTWGVALAIMAWPVHRLLATRIASASLAASLSTTIVFLLIVLPGIFVVFEIGREAEVMARRAQAPPQQVVSRENLETVPGGSRVVTWMDRMDLDIEMEVQKVITSIVPGTQALAEGSLAATAQFLVAMFVLFHVFRDRGEFVQGLRGILPLTRAEGDRVFASAADSVYANLYATVVTGLLDSVTGASLFWALGVSSPFTWGAVMFVLSILPVVGAALVWVPLAIHLAMTGALPAAVAILMWGTFTAVVVDYILYARLAGDRMRMHPVPTLIAFLGGIAVFGLSGMVLGPAIVAVTAAMLDLWRERTNAAGSAMSAAR